ncbi:MAG: 6-carboxytetrahydropterin synthase QueD [Ruminococcus sp.]|jgi:6-pyruvoyltetrahydropterin/6-carboxytetrahydropterin synthase|nr:6-carboxytetrahydropterin synthase QueD [Ruminococcus sp.]
MYSVNLIGHFDAAHFLAGYDGKCKNIHGHRFDVAVSLSGKLGEKSGMVIDFSDAKAVLKNLCERFDHTLIYEKGTLSEALLTALVAENFALSEVEFRPTAEHFAGYFYRGLSKTLPSHINVLAVTVYESPENSATYSED